MSILLQDLLDHPELLEKLKLPEIKDCVGCKNTKGINPTFVGLMCEDCYFHYLGEIAEKNSEKSQNRKYDTWVIE